MWFKTGNLAQIRNRQIVLERENGDHWAVLRFPYLQRRIARLYMSC
ncbi:hypothetical protein XBKQ1_760020 [Xenorhabdus bovienii str. kraussei Quebec]|uniref:Uncharacterized protein n=1 Tax=Xenorhabdus bovienii str. kraussei Quebec TaxID=1398203 RepID=A0A077PMJ4_XENBV|nr:hypothetical protein XBKQ1_760020 [Xenorhabdus bovienii str. kraussei Quebec]